MKKGFKEFFTSKIFITFSLFLVFGIITVFAGNIIVNEYGIQSDNYYSGDGSVGITENVTFKDGDGNNQVLVIKDGLIVGASGGSSGGGNDTNGSGTWWNDNWGKRKKITLTNPEGFNHNHEAFYLNITEITPSSGNYSKELVIIDENDNKVQREIIENGTDWAVVRFYTNVSAGATEDYYLYYENSLASEVDDQIVILSDDFNRADSNIVGNGWTETEGGASAVKIESNKLVVTRETGTNNRAEQNTPDFTSGQFTLEGTLEMSTQCSLWSCSCFE